MADSYGNPFQGVLNPNMRQNGLWDLRMMSAANRSETPFERGARGMYRHQGMGDPSLAGLASMANEPDYSQFTTDPIAHQRAAQMLAPYGLAPLEASQVKQNTFLPNSGFFGNHPRLSAALEGGVYGALASHGGETPGESIQGALEGMVGGRRIRQGLYNQQFARPFEAAGMMEQLQDMGQKRQLQDAEIQHMRAENQKLGRPDHDFRALGNAGPQDRFVPMYDSTTGQITNSKNPNFDASLVRQTRASNTWAGVGVDRTAIAREMGYSDPESMTKADWAKVNKEYEQRLQTASFNRGRGTTEGHLSVPGELTPQQNEHINTIRAQMNKLDTKEETSRLRQEVMLDPKFVGKPLDTINNEVESRREKRRGTFQGQIDDIMNPPKTSSGGVLIEQPDGSFRRQ